MDDGDYCSHQPHLHAKLQLQLLTRRNQLKERLPDLKLSMMPTPVMAPVIVWVVETGRPKREATMTTKEADSSMQNPAHGEYLT
jgi:hypothetical protein